MTAIKVKVEVRGVEDIALNSKRITSRFERRIEDGLQDAANVLMAASLPVSPFQKGLLRESSFVEPIRISGFNTVYAVGYGRYGVTDGKVPASEYAVVQHEFFEEKRTPGTEWKYLETPMRDRSVQVRMINVIQDRMK